MRDPACLEKNRTPSQVASSERLCEREGFPAPLAVKNIAGIARRDFDRLPGMEFKAAAILIELLGGVRKLNKNMIDVFGRKPNLVAQKFLDDGLQDQLVGNVVKRIRRQRSPSVLRADHHAEFVDMDVASQRRQREMQRAEVQRRLLAIGP